MENEILEEYLIFVERCSKHIVSILKYSKMLNKNAVLYVYSKVPYLAKAIVLHIIYSGASLNERLV